MAETTSHEPWPRGLTSTALVVQVLLALLFAGGGVWKLVTPAAELAAAIPWTGEVPPAFLYFIGAVDIAGGLGLLLPALLRRFDRVARAAALGCVLLQASAIVFHLSRGEASDTPFNVVLLGLCVFVFASLDPVRRQTR